MRGSVFGNGLIDIICPAKQQQKNTIKARILFIFVISLILYRIDRSQDTVFLIISNQIIMVVDKLMKFKTYLLSLFSHIWPINFPCQKFKKIEINIRRAIKIVHFFSFSYQFFFL